MPFSRSRSPVSSTRSCVSPRSCSAPDWRSIASTNVVLPWSTCATIATFLKSTREIVPARAFVSENDRGVIQRTRFTAAWDQTRCVDPDDTLTFAVKGVPEPEVMKVSSQKSPSIYAARTARLAGVSLIAVLAVVASMELKNQAPQQVPRANARADTVMLADSDDDDVAQQEE